jgi:hypothetical protein
MENNYPLIRNTKDGETLISQLSSDSLQEIENILTAHTANRFDINEPRTEDGELDFFGDFEFVINDDSYNPSGCEVNVMRWYCDFGVETDYLIEIMKEYEYQKNRDVFSKLFAVAACVEVDIKTIEYIGGCDEDGHERKDAYREATNIITYYPSPKQDIIYADNELEGDYEDPMSLSEAITNILGYIDASLNDNDISIYAMSHLGELLPIVPKQAGEGVKLIENITESFLQSKEKSNNIFSEKVLEVLKRNCCSNFHFSLDNDRVSFKWHSPAGDIPIAFTATNSKEVVDGFAKFAADFDAEIISVRDAEGIKALLNDISDKLAKAYAVDEVEKSAKSSKNTHKQSSVERE